MTTSPQLLTTAEVAREFRVHRETIRRWVREGKIEAVQLPGVGMFRFRREDVDRILGIGPEQASA